MSTYWEPCPVNRNAVFGDFRGAGSIESASLRIFAARLVSSSQSDSHVSADAVVRYANLVRPTFMVKQASASDGSGFAFRWAAVFSINSASAPGVFAETAIRWRGRSTSFDTGFAAGASPRIMWQLVPPNP